MSLKEQIRNDMVAATKSQDRTKVMVLRMLLSEIGVGEKAAKPVDDLSSVKAYKKKLVNSMEDWKSDPAKLQEIHNEIQLIDPYLPKQASPEELKKYIETLPKTHPFGSLMKEVKLRFPESDGKVVSELVKQYIGA